MNQVILVGKIVAEPVMFLTEPLGTLVLQVENKDKTKHNIICYAKEEIIESVKNYCTINTIIGIKGHLVQDKNEIRLHLEKVTFINKGEQ